MMHFFSQYEDVFSVLSLKEDGAMKVLEPTQDVVAMRNRVLFYKKCKVPEKSVVSAIVEHGENIAIVNNAQEEFLADTDAIITKEKNLYLTITVADCFPIFLYDPTQKIIGIAHAGWRGVVKEIAPKTVGAMVRMGGDPKKINVAIGPGISQAHFLFGDKDFVKYFGRYQQDHFMVPSSEMGKVHVNLQAIICQQLRDAGLSSNHIATTLECTYTNREKYFSYRREKKEPPDAMLALIGMKW
ncbi:MAG TPA: peptidoglycan editing factor PgeF [Patescibacteria group bacterium]|nr:peptidoglycan editing factor PgeF [Patescibacteria group bacterium]